MYSLAPPFWSGSEPPDDCARGIGHGPRVARSRMVSGVRTSRQRLARKEASPRLTGRGATPKGTATHTRLLRHPR